MKTQSIIDLLNVTTENLSEIKELSINRFNIVGEIVEVDLNDLIEFTGLEDLILQNLSLNDNDLMIIKDLKKLNKLSLINCEIVTSSEIIYTLKVKNILLDNTNIDINKFNNEFDEIELKNLNLKEIEVNTNRLIIDKCNIDLNRIDFTNINTLVISQSQFSEYQDLLQSINKQIIIKTEYEEEIVL